MFSSALLIGLFALFRMAASHAAEGTAADATRHWLDQAADAGLGQTRREFAARQVLMLAEPSASILITALKGEDGDSALRRQVAARLLGELAPPEAEAALLEAAHGEEYFLAEAARAALPRLYAKLSDNELYRLLTRGARERYATPGGAAADDEDWLALSMARSRRQGGFKALVMRGLALKYAGGGDLPQPLVWCVWEALLDSNDDLRMAGLAMVPRIASSEATEKLAGFLYTENTPKVLVAALRIMREMRPPHYGEAVERQTRHADPLVAVEALAALDAMGYRAAMFPSGPGQRTVAGFVNHPSTPVRRRAIELLIETNNPAALEYLEIALHDRVGANRALAAWGLGQMGLTAAVGMVSPLLNDGRPEVRREAAVALSRLGVVGVAARVLDDLSGGTGPFRLAAAEALGRMGDERAVPGLIDALASGTDGLAHAAAAALGTLKSRRAGPALFATMRGTDDPVLRDACRQALLDMYLRDPGVDPEGWDQWAEATLD
ncbi:MAG: HEAT repeat domain-containing protein [Planctomycetaceae bacterium]|nr:HEAT repeat domain-containing protein [Planctomycetaceae bacterium]